MNKSPEIQAIEIAKHRIIQCVSICRLINDWKYIPVIKQTIKLPIIPSHVFFGDIWENVLLPSNLPII